MAMLRFPLATRVFVCCYLLAASATAALGLEMNAAITSPVQVAVEPTGMLEQALPAVVPLSFDVEAYTALKGRAFVKLEDFPLAPAAHGAPIRHVALELDRIHAGGSRTKFVVAHVDDDGEIVEAPMDRPDVEMFSGRVVGDPDSRVFLSFSPHGTHGYIRTHGSTQLISPGPFGEQRATLIYDIDAIPQGAIQWRDFVCEAETEGWEGLAGMDEDDATAMPREGMCRLVDMAIETDRQFTDNLFSGNTTASGAYVLTLIGASSEIFHSNVNAMLEVVFVRLWTGSHPWTQSSTSGQLNEFRNHWQANMGHVDRHLAHYLSGRGLGGGVAYLGVICHSSLGYALSANLNGFFPYPLQNNSFQNWDIFVVAHELGHNFGGPHTHNTSPPIDCCGGNAGDAPLCPGQDCSVTPNGTIMSYCHSCPGGMSNIVLDYHPSMRLIISNYLGNLGSCPPTCSTTMDIIHVPDEIDTIQKAVQMVSHTGEVIVGPGTYNESVRLLGKSVTLRSSHGPEATIIDATDMNMSAVRCTNGEGPDTIIEGFTFTGGSGSPSGSNRFGGGMFNSDGSPTIINCIFVDNVDATHGGGMYNNGSSPTIINCMFIGNATTTAAGGAIYNANSHPTLINCVIRDNTAAANGGAMFNQFGSNPVLNNCTIYGNAAGNNGGGFYSAGSTTQVTLAGSIVRGNSPNQFTNLTGASVVATYSNIEGGLAGAGNIDADPLFMDASGGDLRLQPGSPSIETGNPAFSADPDATDLDGLPRVMGCFVDMGAYEATYLGGAPSSGDMNADGLLDLIDVPLFVELLLDPAPSCTADINEDGLIDARDIQLFVTKLVDN